MTTAAVINRRLPLPENPYRRDSVFDDGRTPPAKRRQAAWPIKLSTYHVARNATHSSRKE
jgi:hypothetical protein